MTEYPAEINLFDKEPLSVEIPNSGGARKSRLATTGDTIRFPYEDAKTTWEAVHRGCKLSENGQCFGWRSSASGYSWISYSDFIKRAENFGSGLVKIGLTPGQSSSVGIYGQNSVEWVVAQFGIWSQSAILIPLYDTLGPGACTLMINQAEIEIVICDQEQKARHLISETKETPSLRHIILTIVASKELHKLAKDNGIALHVFKEVEDIGEQVLNPVLCPATSDIAIVCYTSGTTGDPKGVMLTHENLMSATSSVVLMLGESGPTKDDTVISYLPQAHMFAEIVEFIFLMTGGSIGFFSGDINKLTEDMRVLQPTIFPAVPRLLNKFYEKAQTLVRNKLKIDFCLDNPTMQNELRCACKPFIDGIGGKLRLIISGAAPVHKNVLEFFTKIACCKVLEAYGQTECAGPCSLALMDSNYSGNVGAPLPCCIVKLVDVPEMGYYSKNLKGEVCMKGPGIFKGYLKNPQKTAETLDADGWLHTGDIGMWLPSGTLKIIDRKKNMFKLPQGLYVAPEKIECIYTLCPFVSQIFVHGDSLKSFLVAIVVPEKEMVLPWYRENVNKCDSWQDICKDPAVRQLILEDLLRLGIEAGLLSFEQVKDVHLHPEVLTLEGGFLTPTSKIKRDACKKHFGKEIEALMNNIQEYAG